MLTLHQLAYTHPNKDILFENISFSVNDHEKIALIGSNGTGKSTLLKIIAGELIPSGGEIFTGDNPCYIPQLFGQFNHFSIAQALKIEHKLKALHEITSGNATDTFLDILNNDWAVEDRALEAMSYWQLDDLNLHTKLEQLSGGQKTKVFLAGIMIHQPRLILLDEPSNHLDYQGRQLLYKWIRLNPCTMIIVSHDRTLLNLLDTIIEMSPRGINSYGGNYDFYTRQKDTEENALYLNIHNKEKELRKAKSKERETIERQQKLDARGKNKQLKAGTSRIMMNTLRNNAEKSTSKTKQVHSHKIDDIAHKLHEMRVALPGTDKMKIGFENAIPRSGKTLFKAVSINHRFPGSNYIWNKKLNIEITGNERIAVKGQNGSGKSTLIQTISGGVNPSEGSVYRSGFSSIYIDQEYSLINDSLSVYEQAQSYNHTKWKEHEIRIRLNRFLFPKDSWDKSCSSLSGGERMRLLLCCLTISNHSPDMILLDEPTNNLDIRNMELLTNAINEYQGTLIVISHDEYFLRELNIERIIQL